MSVAASERDISAFSDYIADRMGMYFPREKWAELEKKVEGAARSLGFPDSLSCMQWIQSSRTDQRKLDVLASCITIGETYFFREEHSFRALEETVFPDIIKAHQDGDRRISLWSAGCSTGEEAYSLAMMVSEAPGLKDWSVSILGTDINRESLQKAERGAYTDWSFRGVPDAIRDRFFTTRGGASWEILPELRKMVSFAYLNLIDDSFPALLNQTNAIDLILCRNVLMYFTRECADIVVRKLQLSLRPNGWLLVSPVETPLINRSIFTPLFRNGAVLYRKGEDTMGCAAAPEDAGSADGPEPVPGPEAVAARAAASQPDTDGARRRSVAGKARPSPEAAYSVARDLYDNSHYRGAIETLEGFAARPFAAAKALALLSRACAKLGLLSEASAWCERAISADAMDASNRYLLALVKIEQRQPDEAIAALRKAIYLDPDLAVAHFTLATLYRGKGMGENCEIQLKDAARILRDIPPGDDLPESEGMTAGELGRMVDALRLQGVRP